MGEITISRFLEADIFYTELLSRTDFVYSKCNVPKSSLFYAVKLGTTTVYRTTVHRITIYRIERSVSLSQAGA